MMTRSQAANYCGLGVVCNDDPTVSRCEKCGRSLGLGLVRIHPNDVRVMCAAAEMGGAPIKTYIADASVPRKTVLPSFGYCRPCTESLRRKQNYRP
jgi:hypothetical protein